jgi:hypothetical protein
MRAGSGAGDDAGCSGGTGKAQVDGAAGAPPAAPALATMMMMMARRDRIERPSVIAAVRASASIART